MTSHIRDTAQQVVPTCSSRSFRASTSILAALAVLMATATVPQLALALPVQWIAALAAAGLVFVLSEALLATTIVAMPAVIFIGGVFGLFAR